MLYVDTGDDFIPLNWFHENCQLLVWNRTWTVYKSILHLRLFDDVYLYYILIDVKSLNTM